jgi:ribosomal protein S3
MISILLPICIVIAVFMIVILLNKLIRFVWDIIDEKKHIKRTIKLFYNIREMLNCVRISKIVVKRKKVIIYSDNCGIVIGKKGELIDLLESIFSVNYGIKKVILKEYSPYYS